MDFLSNLIIIFEILFGNRDRDVDKVPNSKLGMRINRPL